MDIASELRNARSMRIDPHYTDPDLVALYDAECGWSDDRTFYAALPGPTPIRVLDVGCGTGLVTARIAQAGHDVTGVDPAAQMLKVARARPEPVRWVEGLVAQTQGPFDLAIMTGHAFQTLLSDAAIVTLFNDLRDRLTPGGRFVFESRNPARDWASRWTHQTDVAGIKVTRWVTETKGEYVTFTTRYHLKDGTKDSTSCLRFAGAAQITALAQRAGLASGPVKGDWEGAPFDPARHDEMVFEMTPT